MSCGKIIVSVFQCFLIENVTGQGIYSMSMMQAELLNHCSCLRKCTEYHNQIQCLAIFRKGGGGKYKNSTKLGGLSIIISTKESANLL